MAFLSFQAYICGALSPFGRREDERVDFVRVKFCLVLLTVLCSQKGSARRQPENSELLCSCRAAHSARAERWAPRALITLANQDFAVSLMFSAVE